MKIWGEIVGEPKTIPLNVRHVMSGTEVINEDMQWYVSHL